jgi:hypothetical protein
MRTLKSALNESQVPLIVDKRTVVLPHFLSYFFHSHIFSQDEHYGTLELLSD